MRFPFPGRGYGSKFGYGRRRRFIVWPLLVFVLFAALQYFSAETFINPETGEKVKVALSSEQESALGLQSFREVISRARQIEHGPSAEMVKGVARKLIRHVDSGSARFEWMVSLVENQQVNAFCLPGGKIVIFSGILPVAANEGGLAAVMSHEIAHATMRHGAQRMLKEGLIQTAMMGANISLSEMDPQKRRLLLGALGAGVQYGLILPYSRDDEFEADRVGIRYMIRAGFNPEEAVKFWERMSAASSGRSPPEWMSTHPAHGSRIDRIRKIIIEERAH